MRRFSLVLVSVAAAIAQEVSPAPELSAGNVVNAADYRGGAVVPSEIVVLYPNNAGPLKMVPWALDAAHLTQYSVDSLGGTRVWFDELAAPMVYAQEGKLCAIVPYRIKGRKTTAITVEYEGRRSAPVMLPVADTAPAIFTLDASGAGQAAMLNETGCCNSVRNPAVRGTIASLYATGEGLPLPGTKSKASPLPMKVTLGGVPTQIVWSGNVGVLQVNFRVPLNAPLGDAVPLVLSVGETHSDATVTMAVRSQKQQVLIVMSDVASRRRLAGILTGAGYEVLSAPDGVGAVALAKAQNVDLVITDLSRPTEEDSEMMRAIREVHQLVKTVAVAERFDTGELRAADLLGAQAVLRQPLVADAVLARVRALLARRPAVY